MVTFAQSESFISAESVAIQYEGANVRKRSVAERNGNSGLEQSCDNEEIQTKSSRCNHFDNIIFAGIRTVRKT